jgi:hypothetical protein
MSEADQFRQYADEAMSWANQSKTEKEKATLLELARTWMRSGHRKRSSPDGGQLQSDRPQYSSVGRLSWRARRQYRVGGL